MKKNKQHYWVPVHSFTVNQFQMTSAEKLDAVGLIGGIILFVYSLF